MTGGTDAEGGSESSQEARVTLGRLTEQASELGKTAWQVGREKTRASAEAVSDKLDEGYRAVSFAAHREHVERTLEQIADVLVSLDARLSELERKAEGGGRP